MKRILCFLVAAALLAATVASGAFAATPTDEEILAERRQTAMNYMRQMATVIWRATEDIDYAAQVKIDPEDVTGGTRLKLVAGRLYQGVPYSYAGSTGESFMEYASDEDGDGVYEVADLSWRALYGNATHGARIGNDCSGAINQAWGKFGASNQFCATRYWNEAHGYIQVGEYNDFDVFDYAKFFSESGTQGTYGICEENGSDVMYEAYAQLIPADAVVHYKTGGHTMMVVDVNVVYTDGKIDPAKSTISTIHQTKTYSNINKQAHHYNEQLQEDVYQIMGVDDKFTFRTLFKDGYLPVSCKELRDASPVPETYVRDSETEYSGENLVSGIIYSNRIIDCATMTITDAEGNLLQKGTVSTDRSTAESFYGFHMRQFVEDEYFTMRGFVDPYALPAGKYHCKVECRLTTGDVYTVRDFDYDWTPVAQRVIDHSGTTCPMCDATDITWVPITEGITEKTLLNGAKQHYYLANDITNTNLYHLEEDGSSVCLDLNGHNITSTVRLFLTNTNTNLNITGKGTVSGGEAGSYMGAALDVFGRVKLFGGTYQLGSAVEYPVIATRGLHARVDMFDGVTVQGRSDVNTSSILMVRGLFNMHGGVITGGRSSTHGGNIYVGYKTGTATDGTDTYACELHVYGGVIEKGTATERGGNVYVVNEALATFYEDALVTGGSAKNGGNIEVYCGGYVTIDGATIKDGYASSRGGNIYAYGVGKNATMVVNDALIENGRADSAGGNVESYGGTIILNNSTVKNGKTVKSSTYGGNIDVRKTGGEVILNSGTVCDGEATRRGGNVGVTAEGTFIMNGGTVSGGAIGDTNDYGKNIFIYTGGNMIMNGGTVETTTATSGGYGNGIYVYDSSLLTLAGDAKVSGAGGISINSGCVFRVDNSFTGEAGIRWSSGVTQTNGTALPESAGVCGSEVDGVFTAGGSFTGKLRCEMLEEGYVVGVNGQLRITCTEHSWDKGVYTEAANGANGYTTFTCSACGYKAVADIAITTVSLRPGCAGIYYNGTFRVDEALEIKRQGITLSLENELPVADDTDAQCLWTTGDTSVLVTNILKSEETAENNGRNGAMPVYARAYLELADGTYVYGDAVSVSLRQVVEAVDAQVGTLGDTQKTGITQMYKKFQAVLDTWNIPELKNS